MKLHYPEGMKLHGDNACKYHGFEKYDWKTDRDKPAMFWLYFDEDYKLLANHTGKKIVFWHNSDVSKLYHGLQTEPPKWVGFYNLIKDPAVIHVTHNHLLRDELAMIGIHSIIRPVFWGDVNKFTPSIKLTDDVYMCANPGRGIEYGEFIFHSLAAALPNLNFHIFGIDPTNSIYPDNLKYYGWIPEDDMDETVKDFGYCIRWNKHDGSANVILKALLMGQYCITTVNYQGMTNLVKDYHDVLMLLSGENNAYLTTTDEVKQTINNFDFLDE